MSKDHNFSGLTGISRTSLLLGLLSISPVWAPVEATPEHLAELRQQVAQLERQIFDFTMRLEQLPQEVALLEVAGADEGELLVAQQKRLRMAQLEATRAKLAAQWAQARRELQELEQLLSLI